MTDAIKAAQDRLAASLPQLSMINLVRLSGIAEGMALANQQATRETGKDDFMMKLSPAQQ